MTSIYKGQQAPVHRLISRFIIHTEVGEVMVLLMWLLILININQAVLIFSYDEQ